MDQANLTPRKAVWGQIRSKVGLATLAANGLFVARLVQQREDRDWT
jgi:hypothetical protein